SFFGRCRWSFRREQRKRRESSRLVVDRAFPLRAAYLDPARKRILVGRTPGSPTADASEFGKSFQLESMGMRLPQMLRLPFPIAAASRRALSLTYSFVRMSPECCCSIREGGLSFLFPNASPICGRAIQDARNRARDLSF